MTLASISLPQADLLFDPAFLSANEAQILLAGLTAEAAWEQRYIRMFGQLLPQPWTEQELVLSGAMMGYWSRLASSGEPNTNGALTWPSYAAASDENIVFDLSLSTQTGLRAAQCDFWDGITLPP